MKNSALRGNETDHCTLRADFQVDTNSLTLSKLNLI